MQWSVVVDLSVSLGAAFSVVGEYVVALGATFRVQCSAWGDFQWSVLRLALLL